MEAKGENSKKRKKRCARSREVSCELVLSTPSCIHNAKRLHQSPPPPPPMEAVKWWSNGAGTTLSLDLSLSLPSLTPEGELSTAEKVAAGSDSTLISGKVEALTDQSDTAPARLPLLLAASADRAEESNNVLLLTLNEKLKTGDEFQARRGTWQETAKRLMGTEPLRVLEKKLFSTDVSRGHARFLFTEDKADKWEAKEKGRKREKAPRKMLDMLTDAEKAATRDHDVGGLPVLLLNRRGEHHPGNKLRFWDSGNSYVLVGKWSEFVRLNELQADDLVEVYLFRVPPPSPARSSSPAGTSPKAESLAADMELAEPVEAPAGSAEEGGWRQGEWRLAVVLCSRLPPEEEERRRRVRQREEELTSKIKGSARNSPEDGGSGSRS